MERPKKPSKTDINVLPCRLAKKPNYKFVVTGAQTGGRRWRKYFGSKATADAYAHLRRVELSNVGTQGAALSQAQRVEYLDCIKELEPFGISLREAVRIVLPTLAARRHTVVVEKAVATMIERQTADKASKRHLEDLRSRLG